jgi:hypothetical protein
MSEPTEPAPDRDEHDVRQERLREAARAAAREAQALDRGEEGPYEADQARGHHHETDPFEPHERQALDDAAAREGAEDEDTDTD